jgi:hypothetical protein
METPAASRMSNMQGYEKFWIMARRNNQLYITNKVCSALLAFLLAAYTLS